ncbi:DUF4255 domain-containing protein [Streptomyces alanosinicus]|uniref:Pvc16 N-terminal domain-containing protein n=1 Tax=Streptomyces alanosinicus TaxID=68171 RepID=A0A919D4U7_9ACTN|nr:DUF4255 domain-containing protein [Streptomyces alanosinicus]GHE08551.1 hypothetical protein GCM10010339_57740 [Streptomyces alanosinicus]
MSNALAVPTVTAAITTLLQSRVDAAGIAPRPLVAPGPLDDDGHAPRVGVHLYRITRNEALSFVDLPTRTSTGVLRSKPRAALELHYLFTFRGTTTYQSEQLLALCAATLHAVPELTAELITTAVNGHQDLVGSDLGQAVERVRIIPESLTLDEVSRLWALYQPGSFTVTLAAAAGPVLVESSEVPGTVLPVRQVASGARSLAAPRLDAVAGPEGIGAPVRATDPMPLLQLYGGALAPLPGETLRVVLNGTPVATATVVDPGHLTIPLTGLKAGAHSVQVQRLTPPLDPALSSTSPAAASDPVAFTVVPTLSSVTAAPSPGPGDYHGTISAAVVPAVAAPQRVRLLLDSVAPGTVVALALDASPLAGAPPSAAVSAPVADAPRGTYRVTLEVDGVRSMPPLDSQGRYRLLEVTL